jgi:hypothetical protein
MLPNVKVARQAGSVLSKGVPSRRALVLALLGVSVWKATSVQNALVFALRVGSGWQEVAMQTALVLAPRVVTVWKGIPTQNALVPAPLAGIPTAVLHPAYSAPMVTGAVKEAQSVRSARRGNSQKAMAYAKAAPV